MSFLIAGRQLSPSTIKFTRTKDEKADFSRCERFHCLIFESKPKCYDISYSLLLNFKKLFT